MLTMFSVCRNTSSNIFCCRRILTCAHVTRHSHVSPDSGQDIHLPRDDGSNRISVKGIFIASSELCPTRPSPFFWMTFRSTLLSTILAIKLWQRLKFGIRIPGQFGDSNSHGDPDLLTLSLVMLFGPLDSSTND